MQQWILPALQICAAGPVSPGDWQPAGYQLVCTSTATDLAVNTLRRKF